MNSTGAQALSSTASSVFMRVDMRASSVFMYVDSTAIDCGSMSTLLAHTRQHIGSLQQICASIVAGI